MSLDNTTNIQNGPKSKDFNTSLRMGTCIGPSGGEGSGTLGGFVKLKDGGIGALTCAHLTTCKTRFMSQPADAELENETTDRCIFGEVCDRMFYAGSADSTGVDAAIIKITARHPHHAQFVRIRPEQLKFAGFDTKSTPQFNDGKIVRCKDLTQASRHTSVIKVGAETGLTCGKLCLDGMYARVSNREMRLPGSLQMIEFFNQMEVYSISGATRFFDLGDSGALAFMPLTGSELHCIGLCIGCTSYGSCIVTPIEAVFEQSREAVGFKEFYYDVK